MGKKGFTLVELLAVIAILTITTTIGVVGIRGAIKSIHTKKLETKLASIRQAAILYGQDNMANISEEGECIITLDGKKKKINPCKLIKIRDLIDEGYLKTEEKDQEGNLIIKNDLTGQSLNEVNVAIYLKNNRVFASIADIN